MVIDNTQGGYKFMLGFFSLNMVNGVLKSGLYTLFMGRFALKLNSNEDNYKYKDWVWRGQFWKNTVP